jgi:hypothetical protein
MFVFKDMERERRSEPTARSASWSFVNVIERSTTGEGGASSGYQC